MAARYTMKPTASLSISRTYMVFSGVPSSISYTQRPASQCRQLWQSSSRGATCAVYNRAFHSRTRHSQGQSSTASKPAASPTASAAAKPAPTKTTSSAPTPASQSKKPQVQNLASGLSDDPSPLDLANPQADPSHIDWTRSFHGLSTQPFSKEAADVLLKPLSPEDVEIKPDGIIYLPEIKYRRILNKAFGPGGWGLAPRGESIVTSKSVTREYALVAHGRLVSIARGEQDYFSPEGIPTATEGCKSNAMMRCCKDLGVASELWDPRFIRTWKTKHAREAFVEHAVSKKRTKIWVRKGDEVGYPWKENGK